jgi:hypothetical protein
MNLHFEQMASSAQVPRALEPFDRWVSAEGEALSLFYRESDEYVVRFPDRADFTISLDRQTVTCTPAPGVADDVIEVLYFNQIVPLVMGCNGDLVLHASAVVIDGTAIAFLGPTRRGKSTLAAAFAKAGYPFLTDDGLILDQDDEDYLVRPRAPALRLCSDSEAAILQTAGLRPDSEDFKGRIMAGDEIPFHDQPVRLTAIYLLPEPQRRDRTEMLPLSQPAALSELLKHSFILDVQDRQRVKNLFYRLASVVERIDCFTLDYPRRYPELPGVLDSIIKHVRRGGHAS